MSPTFDASWGAPLATPRKCILMVEDEVMIRVLLSDELRDAGYDVIEAVDADEAITILFSQVQIDLVVSDVRMPGSMDGMGLLALVREDFPALPVIITSGHLDPSQALSKGASHFFSKPFTPGGVVKAVQDELSTTP